jgi:hypothetical protein
MIDRVKFTKEFPSLNGNIWIGMEGTVDPGQTPEQLLSEIESKITERMNYGFGCSVRYETGKFPVIENRYDEEYEKLKATLIDWVFKEDAQHDLNSSAFKYVKELQDIVNSKKSKNKNGKD